jgi:hypothetical protein
MRLWHWPADPPSLSYRAAEHRMQAASDSVVIVFRPVPASTGGSTAREILVQATSGSIGAVEARSGVPKECFAAGELSLQDQKGSQSVAGGSLQVAAMSMRVAKRSTHDTKDR